MKPSVLIIESEESPCNSIVLELSDSYATFRARSSSEALEMVRNNTGIDVLLCDLALPESVEINMVQKIRSECKDIPLIVLGSPPGARSVCEAMRHGASTFMLKPLDMPLLEQTIESAVRKRRTPPPADP